MEQSKIIDTLVTYQTRPGSARRKACNLQESKGMGLECANAIGDTKIFGVVPIGGDIVHPR